MVSLENQTRTRSLVAEHRTANQTDPQIFTILTNLTLIHGNRFLPESTERTTFVLQLRQAIVVKMVTAQNLDEPVILVLHYVFQADRTLQGLVKFVIFREELLDF